MTSPGWYNDEQDPRVARWHDGEGWTEHTIAKDSWTGPGSPPPPAGLPAPAVLPTAPPAPSGVPLGRPAAPPPGPATLPVRTPGGDADRPVPLIESPPPPSRRRGRGPGRRSAEPHLITAIASLVVVAVCLLWLQRIDEDQEAEAASGSATTTTTLPAVTAEWATAEGGTYRLAVTPGVATESQASRNGCLPAPEEGRTNATFTIRVENTSSEAAPVPQLAFGVNLGDDGQVDPAITTLDAADTEVEVGPVAAGTSCSLARTLSAANGGPIPPGGSEEFTGTVADVPSPLPADLQLIVRYFPADPNPRGPGFANADLVAPFPDAGTADADAG